MTTRTCPECSGHGGMMVPVTDYGMRTGEQFEAEEPMTCQFCGGDGYIEDPDPYADMTMAEALALDTAKLAALEDE